MVFGQFELMLCLILKSNAKISSFRSWSSLSGSKMRPRYFRYFQLETPSCFYFLEATCGVSLLLQSRSQFWGRIFSSPSYHLNNFYFKKFYHYRNQQALIYKWVNYLSEKKFLKKNKKSERSLIKVKTKFQLS